MKLLFVYNANSDKISVALDFVHKIISPATYACQLCAITYGNFGIKKEWEDFIKGLPLETEFLHKDEFQKKHPNISIDFPVVYVVNNNDMELYISAKDMQEMNLKTLMDKVSGIVNQNK